MQTFPDCFGCVLGQFVSEMNLLNLDQDTQTRIVKKGLILLGEAEVTATAPDLSGKLHEMLRENVGEVDAYAESKRTSHQIAMKSLDDLRSLMAEGIDRLVQGLKVSATGNLVDVVYAQEFHLWEDVEKSVNQDLLGGGVESFRQALSQASHLLYLADNVGETVFDKVFIETLDIPVKYAVKGGPILNDATLEDARAAGIDRIAEIVETGSRSPGTILNECTEEFRTLFNESPLVLAKGQGNYETLDEEGDRIFFLLKLKCPIIAREIGFPQGSLVFKQGALLN